VNFIPVSPAVPRPAFSSAFGYSPARRRGPAPVSGFVISLDADAVQRVFGTRTRTEEPVELFERYEQELNPAPAVSLPVLGSRVRAAGFRVMIGSPFRGSPAGRRMAAAEMSVNVSARSARTFGNWSR